MKNLEVKIEELISLREKGYSNDQIIEYYHKKGIKVSSSGIQYKLRRYYWDRGEDVPKLYEYRNKTDVSIEELTKLRENGLTYKQIEQEINKEKDRIKYCEIIKRIKEYYEKQGKEIPKPINPYYTENAKRMVELREQGLTYGKIKEFLEREGITIQIEKITEIISEHYHSQGKAIPKAIRAKVQLKKRINIPTEELALLREKGYSYQKITDYYNNDKNIKVSKETIVKRIKEYYKEQEKPIPKVKIDKGIYKGNINIPIEELARQKEEGKTYKEIVDYYKTQGIKISISKVSCLLKEYYLVCNKPIPKSKTQIERETFIPPIEEIAKLKEEGYSYEKIAKYCKENGYKISRTMIIYKLRDYYNNKEKTTNQELAKAIVKLIYTRKASLEQIQKIAKEYNVNIEETLESLNSLEGR